MSGGLPVVEGPIAWLARNPFFVLDLTPEVSRRDVERAGQKLAALIAIGAESGSRYNTPFGLRPRDAGLVQMALTALRDPVQRVVHEHFYVIAVDQPAPDEDASKLQAAIDRLLGRLAWPR